MLNYIMVFYNGFSKGLDSIHPIFLSLLLDYQLTLRVRENVNSH